MSSKEAYRKKFEELLRTEERFISFYKYYINNIKDPIILERLEQIYVDEEAHVMIAKNFLEIIDK